MPRPRKKKIVKKKMHFIPRKKFCRFCVDKEIEIDWKNTKILKKYLSDSSKIIPSSKTGSCRKHQKQLTKSIKQARFMAILPCTVAHQKV